MTMKGVNLEHVNEELSVKKFKLETALGSVESDSGNHLVDVASVVGAVLLIYLVKKLF